MTVQEFLESNNLPDVLSGGTLDFALTEFAKFHVEKALRTASEEAYLIESIKHSAIYDTIDKDSIINAYPLTNIK
jgi:hypothetical protein